MNDKVYNSLLSACRENGFSYNSVFDYKKNKGVSAQEAFDYYVKNRPSAKKLYTEKELEIMRKMADAGLPATAAAKVLGRPVKSVQKKAFECKIKFHSVRKLTPEELEWFCDNFGKHTYHYMAKKLGCDIRTLQYRGKRFGLTKTQPSKKLETIREFAGRKTAREIAEILGLSESATHLIAHENHISLACPEKSGRRPWTEQEDEVLRRFHETEGYKALSKRLGTRTPGTVRTRLKVLGLR